MTIRYALPLVRPAKDGSYASSAGSLAFARELRPSPGAAGAEGLELTVASAADRSVFAVFDGILFWERKTDDTGSLRLRPAPLTALNRSCDQLREIVIGPLSRWNTAVALGLLLMEKPSLDGVFSGKVKLGGRVVKPDAFTRSTTGRVLRWRDALLEQTSDFERARFVGENLSPFFTEPRASLKVRAGDRIGELNVGPVNLNVTFEDRTGANALDPTFFLRLMLGEGATPVWSLGLNAQGGMPELSHAELSRVVHPLLLLLSNKPWGPFVAAGTGFRLKNAFESPPLFVASPKAPATTPKRIARQLGTLHGYPLNHPKSDYEWRVADDLFLKYRDRRSAREWKEPHDGDEAYFTIRERTTWDIVKRIWDRHGPAINDLAEAFELPCELVLAFAVHESGGDERPCGLESVSVLKFNAGHLTRADRLWSYFALTTLADAEDRLMQWSRPESGAPRLLRHLAKELVLPWLTGASLRAVSENTIRIEDGDGGRHLVLTLDAEDRLVDVSAWSGEHLFLLPYRGRTGSVHPWRSSRLGKSVPADYQQAIEPRRHPSYTWNMLRDDLEAEGPIWARVSPGLAQTIILTARNTLRIPENKIRFEALGLTLPDLDDGRAIFDWLMTPRHSLAVGVAVLVSLGAVSRLDPMMIASGYNHGSVASQDPTAPNPFNLWTTPGYLVGRSLSLAHCYNAAVRLFERYDLLTVEPTVRFS